MTISKNTFATLLAAVGLATVLATGTITPSLAATSHIHAPTYHARTYDSRAYNAWAATPRFERNQRPGGGWFAHGEADNPPGSAFQDYGEDQSMGMVR
jgi:hypothetical protein